LCHNYIGVIFMENHLTKMLFGTNLEDKESNYQPICEKECIED